MLSPQCTEYPPLYWSYPPLYRFYPSLYWTTSTILTVSPTYTAVTPTVLKVSIHSTEYLPQYWCYPHCTEQPPQYWSIPTVLMLSPRCTEQPPQYWTDVIWGECCGKLRVESVEMDREGWEARRGSEARRGCARRDSEVRAWSSSFFYQLWNIHIKFASNGNELKNFLAWTPLSHFVIQRCWAGICTRRKIKVFLLPG